MRHWLQFWQLRTWIHDNLCYLTIICDTGQHSQFLRCFITKSNSTFYAQIVNRAQQISKIWISSNGVKCILASLLFTFVFILNSTIDIWNLIWRKSQISPEPCQQCWLSGWKIARPQPASPTESIFYSIVCKNTVCKKYKIQFAKI